MKKILITLLFLTLLTSCTSDNSNVIKEEVNNSGSDIEVKENQRNIVTKKEESIIEEEEPIIEENNIKDELSNIEPDNNITGLKDFLGNLNKLKDNYKSDTEFLSCINSSYNSCYSMVVSQNAIENNDASICDDLSMGFSKNECIKTFTVYNAVRKLEMSECENIEGDNVYKVNCKYEVAIALIEEDSNLEHCNEIYKKNTTKKVVENNNTILNDDDLSNEEMFEEIIKMCISTGTYSLAMKTKEIKYCFKLQNIDQIDMCKSDIKNMLEMEKIIEVENK